MPGNLEWVIILIIVLLVFGVGRISKLGEELGKGIRAFRSGLKEGASEEGAPEASAPETGRAEKKDEASGA